MPVSLALPDGVRHILLFEVCELLRDAYVELYDPSTVHVQDSFRGATSQSARRGSRSPMRIVCTASTMTFMVQNHIP
jgi:hypothetical protein